MTALNAMHIFHLGNIFMFTSISQNLLNFLCQIHCLHFDIDPVLGYCSCDLSFALITLVMLT